MAMYLNNRAAEVLVAGDGRAAYWWARAAIHAAPEYAAAYNTLGVIYLRHGDAQLAEGMFRFELARTPQDPTLLSNLVVALDRQGRSGDAARVRQQLAELDRYQPRSEEHTSELQSLMRISYDVFCLKTKKTLKTSNQTVTAQNNTHVS